MNATNRGLNRTVLVVFGLLLLLGGGGAATAALWPEAGGVWKQLGFGFRIGKFGTQYPRKRGDSCLVRPTG